MSARNTIDRLMERTNPAIASYLDACVHCGLCAAACHFYETSGDPRHTPAYKLKPLEKAYKRHKAPFSNLRKAFGLAPPEVSDGELREWQELIYDTCTMCGRCTLACPMGIDIAGTIGVMRTAMFEGGFTPSDLVEQAQRAKDVGSPLGVTPELLAERLEWIADEFETEVPLDKTGAEVMLTASSIEVMKYTESIGSMAKIFNHAGVNWTFSSKGYEATNFGVLSGNGDVNRTMVTRLVDAAEELQVKLVVIPECGHALGALRWTGPNVIGRELPFEVLHISEYLAKLKRDGRLKLKSYGKPMTYHDPCQVSRRGGATKAARELLNGFAQDFRESKHAGTANWCCGGGGGVISISDPKTVDGRLKAFKIKMDQVDDTQADVVVSACSNCRLALDDGAKHYEWGREITNLAEVVAEQLEE